MPANVAAGEAAQALANQSMPAMCRTALMRLPMAPPATKPEATVLPSLRRLALTFASSLLCETKYEIRPPTRTGVLMPIGRYEPSAKASGGIFIIQSRTAKNAPAM